MGFARKGTLALLAGVAAAVIVGCGSGGSLLTSSQAASLDRQLDTISTALQEGDCTAAQNDISQLQSQLNTLNGVNSTLLQNLDQGVGTVEQLTEERCTSATTPSRKHTTTSPRTSTTGTGTSPTTATSPNTATTATQPTDTTPNGGQGLPTDTITSTTGGSSPITTTGTATGTGAGTSTSPVSTTSGTTSSSTSTSPAGGAAGF